MIKFKDFPYERPCRDELMQEISVFSEKFRLASTANEQLDIFKDYEKAVSRFNTMATIASIRNTIDTNDVFYDGEKKYYDESDPLIIERVKEFERAVLDSKFKKELEKELGSLFFLNLELEKNAFSPLIIPLMQEENELCSQYQKLYSSAKIPFDGKIINIPQLVPYKQSPDRSVRKEAYEAEGAFFDTNRELFDDIFDKLVSCRTKQAKALGFNSFVELGYIRRKRNCYDTKGVANYRRQVLEDLVPIVSDIKNKQAKRIGISDFKFYDDTFTFKDGNPNPQGTPDELLAAGRKMYQEMSKDTSDFINLMFDKDLFDVVAKDGKAPGGYCTTISDYKCPFIYSNFNGTAGDVDVLTHEAGHAFASFMADKCIPYSALRQPSMEACEVHSMSMEFLTTPWHHLFFKDQTAKYQLSHAEDALIFIPYGTMVDNFQEIVYGSPELTKEERNEKWAELERKFRPHIDFADLPFYSRGSGWQKQLHIYLYPFYYLDYCLAQTVALQFFSLFLKDDKLAFEKYISFVKQGGQKTFIDLVKSIDFISPMDNGALKDVCATVTSWLSQQTI